MFRVISFAIAIILIGLSLGLLAIGIITGNSELMGGFGAVFAVGVNLLVLPLVLGLRGPSRKHLDEARAAGRGATALVRSIESTNRLINDYRVYRVELAVAARDRSPYRTTLNQPMDPIAGPHLKSGDTISVVRLDPNRPKVVWDPNTRPDAVNVSALANASEWRVPRRAVKVFPIILLFLSGAVAGYFGGEYYAEWRVTSAEQAAQRAEDERTNFFRDGEDLAQALEIAYSEYGSSMTSNIVVHREHVMMNVESSTYPGYFDRAVIRNGQAEISGAANPQPGEEHLFDAAVIDWQNFPNLYQQALKLAPAVLQDNPESMHASIGKPFTDEVFESGTQVQIRLFISNDYESIVVDANEKGEIISSNIG